MAYKSSVSRNDYQNVVGNYTFNMMDNYIYLYHTGTLICLPTYPETISDSMNSNYNESTPMLRSAPIMSYSKSGPRTIQIEIKLHRDLMTQLDIEHSTLPLFPKENTLTKLNKTVRTGENELDQNTYVDTIIKEIQGAALPKYGSAEKMVNPPMAAIRFGNELFCKGVINGNVGVTYSGPLLRTNQYSLVDISFTVTEVDPYDADTVMKFGSFRGLDDEHIFLNQTLERNIYR